MPAYEVSNHAKPGAESRHNLTYWRYGDYAGIGPGAHGRLRTGGAKIATATERKPEDWLALVETDGHGMVDQEVLDYEAQADELLLMGLRLREGVDLARWQQLSHRDPDPAREEFFTGTRVYRTYRQFEAAMHAEGHAGAGCCRG